MVLQRIAAASQTLLVSVKTQPSARLWVLVRKNLAILKDSKVGEVLATHFINLISCIATTEDLELTLWWDIAELAVQLCAPVGGLSPSIEPAVLAALATAASPTIPSPSVGAGLDLSDFPTCAVRLLSPLRNLSKLIYTLSKPVLETYTRQQRSVLQSTQLASVTCHSAAAYLLASRSPAVFLTDKVSSEHTLFFPQVTIYPDSLILYTVLADVTTLQRSVHYANKSVVPSKDSRQPLPLRPHQQPPPLNQRIQQYLNPILAAV